MSQLIQGVRGMHDILPVCSRTWQAMEACMREVLQAYGYQEIRLPIMEKTALFERSIGETTDIVSKEMYTFEDRNGDRLTLRPEGTAGCVRAALQNGLLQNTALRLWYMGPMFRHERPQKGRLRQFHQLGVETFGMPGPDIDAEMIVLCNRMWAALELPPLTLEINSLGSNEARKNYRNLLVDYFQDHRDKLDEDSLTRLDKNPLRILDSKHPDTRELVSNAPAITDCLDNESAEHLHALRALLDTIGVTYQINPRLVRGLDYYNRTVFEFITDALGAQGTVCAGGRYDGLVEQFGGKPVPAIGFAAGLERLVSLQNTPGNAACPDIYFIVVTEKAMAAAMVLAEQLRTSLPDICIVMHCGGGSFKSQFKRADKSGAYLALIMGEDELEQKSVGIKPLRTDQEQIRVPWSSLEQAMGPLLHNPECG